jgi:hypothetical protein|tara:strand:- start:4352 stop:4783 length:432 start_codon:yes stop_codon:yes gene_type:complete
MAVLPVNVETTKTYRWKSESFRMPDGSWEHGPYKRVVNTVRPTKKSFIIVWQLAETLEDVQETLNAAGCTGSSYGFGNKGYSLTGVKGLATRIQNRDKINLKTLRSVDEVDHTKEKAKELDNLRFLADALLAFGEEAVALGTA